MRQQCTTLVATAAVALFFLLVLGAPRASATLTDNILYCTGANVCFNTAPGSGAYWTIDSAMNLTTSSTFDYKLTVTANNGAAGFLQDFSGQYFFGGSQLTNLAWVQNPGGWVDLAASKGGNGGSCQGNTPGAFCGATDLGGTNLALSSTPVVLEIKGNYTGTFLDPNGDWNFQIAAANNLNGTGGNAFAISIPVNGGTGVPDGGMTLMLLGGALVGLATLRRRFSA
jgi:hypothetical protein